MIQRIKFLAVVAIAAVLVACGGGGDDTPPSFEGRYHEVFSLTSNTCANAAATIDGYDLVTQSGRSVNIVSGTLTLAGTVDADNGGFTVSGSTVNSYGITVLATLKYRTTATGGTYTMEIKYDTSTCTAVYVGTATKV